jgi:hypothetical protein
VSYLDLFGINPENPDPIQPAPGDRVTVGGSKSPVWRVIAVNGPTAWIGRDDPSLQHIEGLTPIARLFRAVSPIGDAA